MNIIGARKGTEILNAIKWEGFFEKEILIWHVTTWYNTSSLYNHT
jgi:hypothetical protein